MPYTVNGIGTRYVGKTQLERRTGICEHCGHRGELLSYQARLWVSFLYLPIIPLGHKQVLHECPKCGRHRVTTVKNWQQLGDELLDKEREAYAENPHDPQAAIRLHELLTTFRKRDETDTLAALMASNFQNDVTVQLYLGGWYDQEGRTDEADQCFEQALRLEPHNLSARHAVAFAALEAGDPDRAAQLLEGMERPGPEQNPAALYSLAVAYQQRGAHDKALRVFRSVVQNFPQIGQKDKTFRQAVKVSEKALGKSSSILPKAPLNWRLIGAALLVVALAAGGFGANYYVKTHQPVYLINEFPQHVTVSIPGREDLTVTSRQTRKMSLPEGTHTATVRFANGQSEAIDFVIANSLTERFGKHAFILNPGGSAVLLWERTRYSEHPSPDELDNYEYRVYADFRYLALRKIDYLFEEFPDTIKIESGTSVKKNRLSVLSGDPAELMGVLVAENIEPEVILRYAEGHLLADPLNDVLLNAYTAYLMFFNRPAQGIEFLHQQVAQRPVLVEWHRHYQNLHQATGQSEPLIAQYDAWLAETPEDSALLYLRGRIDPSGIASMRYYDESIRSDAANPYPWFAKAYFLASHGDFAEARMACAQAVELKPDAEHMRSLLFYLRLGLEEYEALAGELQEILKQTPLDTYAFDRLLQVYSRQGADDNLQAASTRFLEELQTQMPDDEYGLKPWAQRRLAYVTQDFAEYVRLVEAAEEANPGQGELVSAYLAQGDLAAAEALLENPDNVYAGFTSLLLWLGWSLADRAAKADIWFQRAVEAFQAGSSDDRRVAQLLNHPGGGVLEAADDLALLASPKAMVYTALAGRYPDERQELLRRAGQLNVLIEPPYFFLQRMITRLESLEDNL